MLRYKEILSMPRKPLNPDDFDHPILQQVVASKKAYCYALLQGKAFWNAEKGYASRGKQVQIGSIKSSDGLGECVFNMRFLCSNPEFIDWRVTRLGQGKFKYERRSDEEIKQLKAEVQAFKEKNSPLEKDVLNNEKILKQERVKDVKSCEQSLESAPTSDFNIPRKFGDQYVLLSFMEKLISYKVLKKHLPKDKYDMLCYMVMVIISKSIKSISYELEAFVREHVIKPKFLSCSKDAIQRFYKYLDANNIPQLFMEKKAYEFNKLNQGSKEKIFIVLDGTNIDHSGNTISKALPGKSKSGNNGNIINFMTIVDQENHDLYATLSYAGNVTDLLTVESICKNFFERGYRGKVVLVSDRGFWSVYNISTMLDYGISFLFNCNVAKTSYIKKWALNISKDLFINYDCITFKAVSALFDKNTGNTRILSGKTIKLSWSFVQHLAHKLGNKQSRFNLSKISRENKDLYAHFIFSRDIYNDLFNKINLMINELNEAYNDAKNWQDVISGKESSSITAEHFSLITDGLVTLSKTREKSYGVNKCNITDTRLNHYAMNYQALSEYCRVRATRVLVSDCVENCIEANMRYSQRNNVEVGYSMLKGELGGSNINASTDKTVNSKIFLLGLATELQYKLIEANRSYNKKLKATGEKGVDLEQNSIRATLRILESIEASIDKKNGKIILSSGITKRLNNLIKSFGLEGLDSLSRAVYAHDEGIVSKKAN